MKILIQHDSDKFQGGGSTFITNFAKAINKYGHEVIHAPSNSPLADDVAYDVLFIAGATLADREQVLKAKKDGKPIILRVDNLLEDRKNRSSGMPRLLDYAELCDVIVYQSEWAKRLLSPLLGNGIIIHNGVDTDIFKPRTEPKDWDNIRVFYSKYSRNEVKQFHEVQYWWREYNLHKKDDTLVLVGKFADDYLQIEHPFDFHNDEIYEYKGLISRPQELALVMQKCDVAFLPYMFDACSNTILEAQACGLPVIYSPTGGTPEIVTAGWDINYEHDTPVHMVEEAMSRPLGHEQFKDEFGLEKMGQMYDALLKTVTGKAHEV